MSSIEFEENKTKDLAFAKLVIKKKLTDEEDVKTCLSIQKKKDATGTYIPLYKVLIGKNFLSQEDAKAVLKELKDSSGGQTKKTTKEELSSSQAEIKTAPKPGLSKSNAEIKTAPKPGLSKSNAEIEVKTSTTKKSTKKEAKDSPPSTPATPEKLPEGNVRIGREMMTNYKLKFRCDCKKEQVLSHKFIGKSGTCTGCQKPLPVPMPDNPLVICLVCDCGKDFDKNSAGCTFCGLRKPPTLASAGASGKVDLMQQLAEANKEEKKARASGKKVESLIKIKNKVRADRFVEHDELKPKKNPIIVYLQVLLPVGLFLVIAVLAQRFMGEKVLPKNDPTRLTDEQLTHNVEVAKDKAEEDKKAEKLLKQKNEQAKVDLMELEFVTQAMECYPLNQQKLGELISESAKQFRGKYPYTGDLLKVKVDILYYNYLQEVELNKEDGKPGTPSHKKIELYENRVKVLTALLTEIEECQNYYRRADSKTLYKIPERHAWPDNNLSREYKELKEARQDLDYFFEMVERKKEDYRYKIKQESSFDFGE